MNYSHTAAAAEATVVRGNTELVLCERNMLNIVTGIISVVVDDDDATTMMLRNHCHISTTKHTLSTVSTTSAHNNKSWSYQCINYIWVVICHSILNLHQKVAHSL